MKKTIVYISLFSFLYYSLSGCAVPQQTQLQQNGKYNEVVVADQTFHSSKEEVYKAGISILQKRNFMITLSDPTTGLVTGEYSSSRLLPEEEKALEGDSSKFLTTCITVVGIVLIVGLIFMLLNSDGSSSSSSSNSNATSSNEYHSESDSRVHSYKYFVSIQLKPILFNETDVSLHIIRMDLENGAVVKQSELQNQLFNKTFFSAMEEELAASK